MFLRNNKTGNLYEVARARAYAPSSYTHNCPTKEGHLRVKLVHIPDNFKTLELLETLPQVDIFTLEDVVGTFVLWPISQMKFGMR